MSRGSRWTEGRGGAGPRGAILRAYDRTETALGWRVGRSVARGESAVGPDAKLTEEFYRIMGHGGILQAQKILDKEWRSFDRLVPHQELISAAADASSRHASSSDVTDRMVEAQLDVMMSRGAEALASARRTVSAASAFSTRLDEQIPSLPLRRSMAAPEAVSIFETGMLARPAHIPASPWHPAVDPLPCAALSANLGLGLHHELDATRAVTLLFDPGAFEFPPRSLYYTIFEMVTPVTPEVQDTTKSARLSKEVEGRARNDARVCLSKIMAIVHQDRLVGSDRSKIASFAHLLGGIEWR